MYFVQHLPPGVRSVLATIRTWEVPGMLVQGWARLPPLLIHTWQTHKENLFFTTQLTIETEYSLSEIPVIEI